MWLKLNLRISLLSDVLRSRLQIQVMKLRKRIGRVSLVKKQLKFIRVCLPRFISGFENKAVSKSGELLSRNFKIYFPLSLLVLFNWIPSFFQLLPIHRVSDLASRKTWFHFLCLTTSRQTTSKVNSKSLVVFLSVFRPNTWPKSRQVSLIRMRSGITTHWLRTQSTSTLSKPFRYLCTTGEGNFYM